MTIVRIHTYARQGNIQGVAEEIAKGVDVDSVDQNNSQTSLMYAVSSKNADINLVRLLVENGADINAIEAEFQTPVLGLAVQSGNLAKIKYLLDSGAKIDYQRPHGYDVLIDAMHGRDIVQDPDLISILKLLLTRGAKVNGISSHGETALKVASRVGRFDAVKLLLKAGAKIGKTDHINEKAITKASNLSIVRMLMAAGSDLNDINEEMRKELTGVSTYELETTEEQYLQGKHRRFGTTNPEIMDVDFWQGMIRWGMSAWDAKTMFNDTDNDDEPVWCYSRFGRTITELPDGRIIEIAGEHEDYYDPDFCIYNDVVVYDGQGSFQILGYPRDVFPPTDFHTATLVGKYIYIIGNLGYISDRISDRTPVYKLDWQSFQIEPVSTTGTNPGWISKHQAVYHQPSNTIQITSGAVWRENNRKAEYIDNYLKYTLDLSSLTWKINQ